MFLHPLLSRFDSMVKSSREVVQKLTAMDKVSDAGCNCEARLRIMGLKSSRMLPAVSEKALLEQLMLWRTHPARSQGISKMVVWGRPITSVDYGRPVLRKLSMANPLVEPFLYRIVIVSYRIVSYHVDCPERSTNSEVMKAKR